MNNNYGLCLYNVRRSLKAGNIDKVAKVLMKHLITPPQNKAEKAGTAKLFALDELKKYHERLWALMIAEVPLLQLDSMRKKLRDEYGWFNTSNRRGKPHEKISDGALQIFMNAGVL